MKERMPFKKSVRMSMYDRVLMICLSDFHETLYKNFFEKLTHITRVSRELYIKIYAFLGT
jgi:hypothetical protein